VLISRRCLWSKHASKLLWALGYLAVRFWWQNIKASSTDRLNVGSSRSFAAHGRLLWPSQLLAPRADCLASIQCNFFIDLRSFAVVCVKVTNLYFVLRNLLFLIVFSSILVIFTWILSLKTLMGHLQWHFYFLIPPLQKIYLCILFDF